MRRRRGGEKIRRIENKEKKRSKRRKDEQMSVKKRADIESLVHSLPLYSIQ
jgi:hypothetical protein